MMTLEQQVLRMELQIGELIRIVATLNDRLKEVEEVKTRRVITKIPISHLIH